MSHWRAHHEQNRASWNAAVPAHNRHKGDQAAFLRDGGSTLFPDELALLGPLDGLRIAHVMCNCGQDTLSLAARGAKVTGVDISEVAIAFGERLSADSGIAARFVRSDVLDWLATTDERFDVVFASYGAFGWIGDLDTLVAGIRRVLEPGGRLVYVEFHPIAFMFDPELVPFDVYASGGQPIIEPGVSDYVQRAGPGLLHGAPDAKIDETPFENPHVAHGFAWGIADVVGAVLRSGMRLTRLTELDYSNGWKPYRDMTALPGRRWALPPGKVRFPLMYTLEAERT